MKPKSLVLTSLLLMFSTMAESVPHQYYLFDNLRHKTQNLCVRDIAQSGTGMIWIAAENGLYSYDGYNLRKRELVLNGKHEDDAQPRFGSFNCIFADKDSLIVGTDKGVLSFCLVDYKFRQLNFAKGETAKSIIKAEGCTWVATSTAVYKNGKRLPVDMNSPIINMYYDDGALYIGTSNEMLIYDTRTQRLDAFGGDTKLTTCFGKSGENELWIGTSTSVMLRNTKTHKNVFSLNVPVTKTICTDKQGNVLVGTDNGLYIIDKNKSAHHITHDARIKESLAGDIVWSVFRDKDDNIWIGTNCGVSLVQNNETLTTYTLPSITGESSGNQIYCICHDSNDRYWFGGTDGLICIENFRRQNQSYRWYRMNDSQYDIGHNRVRCIHEDPDGRIWVGGDMGMLLLNETTHQFEYFQIKEDDQNWIYNIKDAGDGRLEVTTYKSQYIVEPDHGGNVLNVVGKGDRHDGSFQRLCHDAAKVHKNTEDFFERIGMQGQFMSLYTDKDNLIFGGIDKVAFFDAKKAKTREKELRMPEVTEVCINYERYVPNEEVISKSHTFEPDDKLISLYLSDFDYSGEIFNDYYYKIDGATDWIRFDLETTPITINNIAPGQYTLLVKRSGEENPPSIVFCFEVKAHWYNTTFAHIVYVLLFIAIIYGLYRYVEQRKRWRAEREERAELLAMAKKKEKELLDENGYLSNQLRIKLLENACNEGELSNDEKFLLDITRIIEENMDDSELNVNTLSEKSGISTKQLYRRIKAMTGLTTVAYIRDQRLKKAASLLMKGTFTVSEVMYMVGFSSASYFTRCFTEEFGKSPSEYKSLSETKTL